MAKLLKNELKIEVKDGKVFGTRIIEDEQGLVEFIEVVEKTEKELDMMKNIVENFDDAVESQKQMMKADFKKRRELTKFKEAWDMHLLGMNNQKRQWAERDIPNIEAEIEILRQGRLDCIKTIKATKAD